MAMETSFRNRVELTFGGLLGSSLKDLSSPQGGGASSSSSPAAAPAAHGGSANSWSVSEVAIPCTLGSRPVDESSGSDGDEPCAAQYEKFVKLAKRARRRRADDNDEGTMEEEIDLDEGRPTKQRRGGEVQEEALTGNVQEDLDEDDECREMRLMVGMDDTLDFEEEEDEYDKLAVGREGAGERMYMREITGKGRGMSPLTPLPVPGAIERKQFGRDLRANHTAAAARLKEDDKLAALSGAATHEVVRINFKRPLANTDMLDVKSALKSTVDVCSTNGGSEGHASDKYSEVVKREDSSNGVEDQNLSERASNDKVGATLTIVPRDGDGHLQHGASGAKREEKLRKVRFAVDELMDEKESLSSKDVKAASGILSSRNKYGRVPDHVRNPSKYTHYTLDWSDEEDGSKSNLAAFQATWALTHASDKQEGSSVELPKSITFTPKSVGISSKGNGEAKSSTNAGTQPLVSFVEGVIDDSVSLEESSLFGESSKAPVEAKVVRRFRKRGREEENEDIGHEG